MPSRLSLLETGVGRNGHSLQEGHIWEPGALLLLLVKDASCGCPSLVSPVRSHVGVLTLGPDLLVGQRRCL